jgi:hypothetical protein
MTKYIAQKAHLSILQGTEEASGFIFGWLDIRIQFPTLVRLLTFDASETFKMTFMDFRAQAPPNPEISKPRIKYSIILNVDSEMFHHVRYSEDVTYLYYFR